MSASVNGALEEWPRRFVTEAFNQSRENRYEMSHQRQVAKATRNVLDKDAARWEKHLESLSGSVH